MEFHRVLIDGEVHAYRPYARETLCLLDKQNRPTPGPEYAVTCEECIDQGRAGAVREADRALGLELAPRHPMYRVADVA